MATDSFYMMIVSVAIVSLFYGLFVGVIFAGLTMDPRTSHFSPKKRVFFSVFWLPVVIYRVLRG